MFLRERVVDGKIRQLHACTVSKVMPFEALSSLTETSPALSEKYPTHSPVRLSRTKYVRMTPECSSNNAWRLRYRSRPPPVSGWTISNDLMSARSLRETLRCLLAKYLFCGSFIAINFRYDLFETTFRTSACPFQLGAVERRRISDCVNNHPSQLRGEIGHAGLAVSDWLVFSSFDSSFRINKIIDFQPTYNIMPSRRFQSANIDIFSCFSGAQSQKQINKLTINNLCIIRV